MNLLMQALKLSHHPDIRPTSEAHAQCLPQNAAKISAHNVATNSFAPERYLPQVTQIEAPLPLLGYKTSHYRIAASIVLITIISIAVLWQTYAPSATSVKPQASLLPASQFAIAQNPNSTHIEPEYQSVSTHATDTNILTDEKKVIPPLPHALPVSQNEFAVSYHSEEKEVEQRLNNAYMAYQSGENTAAWAQYLEVLARDEDNLDAMLGLAAIAQQQERNALALAYYQRILKLDPQNVSALASLSKYSSADLATNEGQLKQLILKNPEAAEPYFALGNQYATQSRWADAQKAYSHALAINPDNGLIAFNLAVALDHLGQYRGAAKYYQEALNRSSPDSAEINRPLALQRIAELNALD